MHYVYITKIGYDDKEGIVIPKNTELTVAEYSPRENGLGICWCWADEVNASTLFPVSAFFVANFCERVSRGVTLPAPNKTDVIKKG